MNIKFANGTNFEYLNALETEQFYNGASRRTLSFEAAVGAISVDTLNTILNNEANTKVIELSNGDVTNIYDGYVLKMEVGVKPILVQAETPESAAVYQDRLVFKLGKRTYIEEALKKLGL